jgi:hypothetical protein
MTMQLDDIDKRIHEAIADERELPRLSRELGRELPRHRWEVLDEFRTAVERTPLEVSAYTRGFLDALSAVSESYQAEVLPQQSDERVAALARRRNWRPVLQAMANGPVLPTDLRIQLQETELSTVSRRLRDMRQVGLVDLLSPPGAADGRTRPHHLTAMGRRILDRLSQEVSRSAGEPALNRDESGSGPKLAELRQPAEAAARKPANFPRLVRNVPVVSRRALTL